LATKDLLKLYDWSESTVADMNATFLFTYSLGGFFLSHLGDIYSKRKLICFMYTIIALVEVALGCLQFIDIDNQSAAYFYMIKAVNGAV
jgi:sugar phosphate permease